MSEVRAQIGMVDYAVSLRSGRHSLVADEPANWAVRTQAPHTTCYWPVWRMHGHHLAHVCGKKRMPLTDVTVDVNWSAMATMFTSHAPLPFRAPWMISNARVWQISLSARP